MREASEKSIARGLQWFFFVLGACSLVAAGIYLGTAMRDPDTTRRLLRAMMFTLSGLFFLLMYGENRSRVAAEPIGVVESRPSPRNPGEAHQEQ